MKPVRAFAALGPSEIMKTHLKTSEDIRHSILRHPALSAILLLAMLAVAASSGWCAQDITFVLRVNGYEMNGVFGEPTAVAVNERAGLLCVTDTKYGRVDAFSLQGVPKFEYGPEKGLESPWGIAVADDGTMFVSESTGGPIKIIGPKGDKSTLDLPKSEGESDPKPGRMTLDRDGCLYVVDRANCRVCVFDKERKIKLQFGRAGGKRGEFKELQDVAVDRQGRIYVLDSSGTPVQVFDKKGKYVYRFGFRGEGGEDISFPSALFVDQNDQVWVVDRGRHKFKVFDRSGSFLRSEGTYGLEEGYLFQPADAEMDGLGRIYVVEAGARRLQVFSLDRPFEPFSPPGL